MDLPTRAALGSLWRGDMLQDAMSPAQPSNSIVNPSGKMPVGLSNFARVRRDDYCFVDKTLFIKEVLDTGDGVVLLTRPRRFGKTINMNMLHCFLQQPAGGCRDAINRVSTTAERSEENDLFADLAISQAGERYHQERGKRPVIFLSFRAVKELEWEPAFRRMSALLSDLAQEASQEAPVNSLTSSQQDILRKVIRKQAQPEECESILAILTKLLTLKHEGVTPWVLIDEYDAPMQAAYQYNYYKPMRNLMKGLLGDCLKDNQSTQDPTQTFIHKAVITGIVRVAKEDIFSDLNNVGVYGVAQDRFASCFGFTESEVKDLLGARGLADRFDAVRDWYNGYLIGMDNPATLYNPWSVINYLANPTQTPQPYWVNTSTNHLVHELLTQADVTVKRGLRELLDPARGHATAQSVCEYVPLRDVKKKAENLWGLLLAAGYLTRAGQGSEDDDEKTRLRIPNAEVRRVYGDLVNQWLRGGESGSGGGMELLEALVAGNLDVFAEEFSQLVEESVGYFDTGGKQPERFYHGFVLGMVQYLHDRYVIRSERESGLGRYDLALEPKDKSMPGFVMEFKKGLHADGTLEQAAHKALAQIKGREYHADLFARGVRQVIALGLAFRGKEARVEHEALVAASQRQFI
ncbi:MAG: AAA family ATPase [Myxococcota bacterium]